MLALCFLGFGFSEGLADFSDLSVFSGFVRLIMLDGVLLSSEDFSFASLERICTLTTYSDSVAVWTIFFLGSFFLLSLLLLLEFKAWLRLLRDR